MLIGADVVDVPMSVVEILSFKSTMIRCAVFNPIPLTVFSNLSFPLLITLQSSEGVRAEVSCGQYFLLCLIRLLVIEIVLFPAW